MLDQIISTDAVTLYRRLLDGGAHAITSVTGPFQPIEQELIDAGLVDVVNDFYPQLVAVAPAIAAQVVLRRTADRISEWHQGATKTAADLLSLEHHSGPGTAHELIDIVSDSARILPLVDDIQRTARRELLSFEIPVEAGAVCVPRLSPASACPPPTWRTVFTTDYLDPQRQHLLDTTIRLGGQARLAETIPMKLLIADRSRALVPLDRAGVVGVVHVRAPVIIDALVTLFDAVWDRAQCYPPNITSGGNLTPFERQVATLLCTGRKDDHIAASLHVSVRTVRRNIASIMDRLGVDTRFAAGVQITRRGWI